MPTRSPHSSAWALVLPDDGRRKDGSTRTFEENLESSLQETRLSFLWIMSSLSNSYSAHQIDGYILIFFLSSKGSSRTRIDCSLVSIRVFMVIERDRGAMKLTKIAIVIYLRTST